VNPAFAPPIPVTSPSTNDRASPSPASNIENLIDEDPLLITSMCTTPLPDATNP
jgi:hypothetical protein